MAVKYVEANKMDSNFRKLNGMLSLWYGIITGILQIYLIVQNVWKFVRLAELPWPNQEPPTLELNIFIGLNGFAVLLLPFFITACFLKIGNLANDNEMLGKRVKCIGSGNGGGLSLTEKGNNSGYGAAMWTHFGPISSLLHIICSVCLLFPQTLVDGVLIKNGFLPKSDVWKSDLDFMNDPEPEDMVIRPIGGDNGLTEFAKRLSPLAGKNGGGLRLEFINYAMALFIYSIRYAQVFWSCHKKFAIILGLQQITNSIHTLVCFSTLVVLYKVHVAGIYTKSSATFLLDGQMTLLIFGIALTVLFLSSCVLYYLGYLKLSSFLQEKAFDKTLMNYSGDSSSSYGGGGWAYFPHSAAVSIALALAAAQSPLVHDAFVVYQLSTNRFLLAFPVSSVAYFLLWAMLWLGLTIARNWRFSITATIVQPIQGLQTTGLPTEITIDLKDTDGLAGPFSPSLVVISEGKAFSVENSEDQKSILALIPKTTPAGPASEPGYWRKSIASSTPTPSSCLSYKQKDHSKVKYMPCRKEVTFDDEVLSPRYSSRPSSRAERSTSSRNENSYARMEDFDAGEYAFLSRNGQNMKSPGHHGHGPLQTRESIYGQLQGNPKGSINFMERNQVISPSSTVDSSSGVSSISGQSQLGPPSTSASCSQFSDGGGSEMHIVEPKAHYEPLPVRAAVALSRRNSVRSYISSTHQNYAGEDHHSSPQKLIEEVYGKLKNNPGREVRRSESIYSVASRTKANEEVKLNKSIYEHCSNLESPRCNFANNNPKFRCENGSSKSSPNVNNKVIVVEDISNYSSGMRNNSKNYDFIDDMDMMPPIPPPLPILSCVIHKNNSDDDVQVI